MKNAEHTHLEETVKTGGSDLAVLCNELKKLDLDVITFFKYLRFLYLRKNIRGKINTHLEEILGSEEFAPEIKPGSEKEGKLRRFISKNKLDWGNIDFHLNYRLTSAEELLDILKINGGLKKVIKRGYAMSIMPLNIVTENPELLNKFIPKGDFFTEHYAKHRDPYAIFSEKAKIVKKGHYLASQKFKRSILMNITSACPIGCVSCYKGEFTRVRGRKFYTNLSKAVNVQSKLLVEHLNKHPEIKLVVVSGGEPLLLSNEGIKKMLNYFERARHLAEFRICTGTIFQGLPFRIDDELLDALWEFENRLGIKVTFSAHLSHPAQFTPEALIAISKITRRGFPINTQVPLQGGVNIFINDFKKTMNTLYKLAELQGINGCRPYKYILDMNVGSLEYSVPLEFMLKVLAELKYRIDHPWPETWQPVSYTILCKEGNVLLSPHMLLCMNKKISKYKNAVEYYLPVPAGEGRWKIIKYAEPLLEGCNDDPNSLKSLDEKYITALKSKIERGEDKNAGEFGY